MKIEKLDDFILQMPIGLDSILKKARQMYLELGKRSFYDRRIEYMMFGEEADLYIYNSKSYENPNIVVCTTLIKQYEELLNKLGIKTNIITERSGHSYLEFGDEYGVSHIADLTRDLKNIQFNCSTSHFARSTVDSSTLRKIDIELNYITENKGYSNEYWHLLKDKLDSSNFSARRKLEITVQSMQEFGDLSKLGESELFSMYQKFVRYCMGKQNNIHFYTTKKSNYPEEFYMELEEEGNKVIYRLNKSTLQFDFEKQQEKDSFIK